MGVEETGVTFGSHSVATEVLRHRLGCSERGSGEIGNILDEVLDN